MAREESGQARVYPRVCGGTTVSEWVIVPKRGSIPACAGEPSVREPEIQANAVYPRVCGGTSC